MTRSSEAERPLTTRDHGRACVRSAPGRQITVYKIEQEDIQTSYAVIILIGVGLLALWEALR